MSSSGENPTFAFYLVPGFSLVALSCAIDVLRAANVELNRELFTWHLTGADPADVDAAQITSSSGLSLAITAPEHLPDGDHIVICGGERSHLFKCNRTENWLRQQARLGKNIGSVSDGAFILAQLGLFDDCRSTIHWKCQSAYRERHPNLDIRISIIEVDGNRFSCAGGTSSLDLMLRFVTDAAGEQVAGRIADNYFHDVIRGDDQQQHQARAIRFANHNKKLYAALQLMEGALEKPYKISDIASAIELSSRQLDRLFRHHLNTSPSRYYLEMRLARASGMLKQTAMSVGEIALGCGFQSASHLGKYFKEIYGLPPGQFRAQTVSFKNR